MRRDLEDLVPEYIESREKIRAARRKIRHTSVEWQDELDITRCNSMEKSITYSIQIMQNEVQNTNVILVGGTFELDKLGKRASTQLGESADAWIDKEESASHFEEQHVDFRSFLSERESLCLLAHERGMSFGRIAEILGVSRTAVQSYIERGRKKIAETKSVQVSLFDTNPYLSE